MPGGSSLANRLAALEARFEALARTVNDGPAPVIGASALILMDGETLRGAFSTPSGAALLSLSDVSHKPRLFLGVAENGAPMLATLDGDSRKRIDLQVAPNDVPALYVMDPSGAIRVRCEVDPHDAPAIGVCDRRVQARAAVGVTRTGNPFIGTR